MKTEAIIKYLTENHYQEFIETYKQVDQEFQEKYPLFCVCGKLSTGLHETYCKRAREAKYRQTIERLSHLLAKK